MRKMSILRCAPGIAFIFIATLTFFTGCKQADLFEKNTVIPGYKWQSGFTANGSFHVTDTASSYKVYIVLRHTDAYSYNNIWLNVGFREPGDSMRFEKLNLTLGNDAEGWEGTGMNDIWEVRKAVPFTVKKAGDYRFSIAQVMRDDPLPAIMSVGMRIEKQENRP